VADRPLRPAPRRCLGGPLPHQQADRPRAPPEAKKHFLIGSCGPIGISGISTGFPVLSQSSGQVAHVLLTRSPLALHQYCYRMERVRLACVRHAASVRPEPGSNSPSRLTAGQATSKEAIRPNQESESRHALTRAWQPQARNLLQDSKACLLHLFDSQPFPFPANRNREDCPHWLLALTISFSRSDRAHTDPAGVGAGCPKGLFRTYCNCRKVSFGRRKARGPTRRACHLIRCASERQRVQARKGPTQGASPGRPLLPIVPARPTRPADPHSGLTWASPFGFPVPGDGRHHTRGGVR
jgi:hypothetical protein